MSFTDAEATANLAPDQVVDFTGAQAAPVMAPNSTDRMFNSYRLAQNQTARAGIAAARPAAAPANVREVSFSPEQAAAVTAPNSTDTMFNSYRLAQNQAARAANRVRGFI
jgi:hypothetical protein